MSIGRYGADMNSRVWIISLANKSATSIRRMDSDNDMQHFVLDLCERILYTSLLYWSQKYYIIIGIWARDRIVYALVFARLFFPHCRKESNRNLLDLN